MYRIVFVLLVLALLVPGTASAQGPPDLSFHEVYEAVHNGVIQLTNDLGTSCSGWIKWNLAITNYHCVRDAHKFWIWHPAIGVVDPWGLTTEDRPRPTGKPADMFVNWDAVPEEPEGLPARLIGIDPEEDLAILLVDNMPSDIISLPMANPDTIRVGDLAFLIGYPLGLWLNFNLGVVSTIEPPLSRYFQTDQSDVFVADMWSNKGNSGGPVLNINGEVMGMVCGGLVRNNGLTPTGLNIMVNIKHVEALIDSAVAYDRYMLRYDIKVPGQEKSEPESEAGILDQIGGWRDVMPH